MNLDLLYGAFQNPPSRYRVTPLLRINDDVDEEHLRAQIRSMKAQGFGGVFLCCEHFGTAAPHKFLSDWWWGVVDAVARLCGEEGLAFWVYDDEDWPSGSIGGQLTQEHPEHQWKYLHRESISVEGPTRVRQEPGEGHPVAAVAFRTTGDRVDSATLTDLTERIASGVLEWDAPEGSWIVELYTARPGLGIFLDGYGDLMDREAMGAFVSKVYEAHADRVSRVPGGRIEGYFTDEPAFSYAMIHFGDRFTWYPSMPYTPELESTFERLHGYNPRPYLPLLYREGGPEKLRFTCHYWDTCRHLYCENYYGQIYRFCDSRGMKATGHLVVEEKFSNHLGQQAGNIVCHFRYMHIPGMDWIHPFEETFHHLPSTTPKYPASMAHLMGRDQTWAESFAASGWGLAPREMRRIVNWEHVNGISMQVPISYKYSLRGGDRSQFYPPGISYQQPYWDHMRAFADYEARMCALAAGGGHVAQVALCYPEVDLWVHCWEHDLLDERAANYNRLGDALRFAGYDYDILDDEAFLEHARIEKGRVVTATEGFDIAVVPGVDGLRRSMASRLLELVASGGTVVFTERLPRHSYEGGGDDPELAALLERLLGTAQVPSEAMWKDHPGGGRAGFAPTVEEVPRMLAAVAPPDLQVDGDAPLVAYHRRLDDGHLYLIFNYSDEARTASFTVGAVGRGERWLPDDGGCATVEHGREGDRTRFTIRFEAQELVPLILRDGPGDAPRSYRDAQEIALSGPFRFSVEETLRRPEVAWNFSVDQEGLEFSKVPAPHVPETLEPGDWCRNGLTHFSGIGIYETEFTAPDVPVEGRVLLDLGDVRNSAEVRVNGEPAGITLFEPHRLDITERLRPGTNVLTVRVANTLSNYMSQFPVFQDQPLNKGGDFPERRVSGLLGPVKLVVQEKDK